MGRRLLLLALFCLVAVAVALGQVSPHGPMKIDCQTCHLTDSWEMRRDEGFNHATTGFPLIGRHKSIDCASCHEGLKFSSQSPRCLSCHTDVHKSELGENCMRCHTSQSWRIPDMIDRHQQTRFPLVGRHLTLTCESCHANALSLQYSGTSTTCIGCHRVDFQTSKNPNHTTAGFSTECTKCHRVTAFTWGQGFDHDLTAFPLAGAHKAVACASCHQNGQFKGTSTQCSACHRDEFMSTTNPNHASAGFSMECQTCHSFAGWSGVRYDHTALTRFPLTGAHTPLQCSSCHGDNVFAGRSVDCVSCHLNAFTATRAPNHVSNGFPQQCSLCHSTMAWAPSSFNHAASRFPLTGAHQAVVCAQCHVNNQYQGLTTNCYDCHTQVFNAVASPNHVTGNFSHTCTQCHTTTTWTPSTFNHAATRFALTGAHIGAQCQSCHTNGNYQLVYTDCYQCHQTQFQQTTNPNHVAGNFSHDCTQCHSTMNWSSATFNHSTTLFPLTGAHITASCQSCHVNGNYQLHYTDCYQCHQTQFQQATNPNHVAGNFSHSCTQCHSTINWSTTTFNHSTTLFPLTGAHVIASCQSCHVNGNYQLHYTDCYQCHQTEFQQATNPNHVTGNFSHDCTQCHNTAVWQPSTFNHSTTLFPLTGAHVAAQCQSCHVNGNYQLHYTDCFQCHQAQFQQATNPNHVTGNFSHDCTQCHNTTVWQPSTFNHSTTLFPLTGAHVAAQCQSCHVNGNYQLHYTDCFQCHQAQFQQATNPNHVTGNFSHDCTQCHNTAVWQPSTFNHSATLFPLTGAHITASCQSCHVNGNYQLHYTDCYQCHQTQFQQAVNPNHVAGNFSHDCTQCHGTASWQPSTFNHNTTPFPLTGAHFATPCQSCHVNGNYQLHFTDCYQCHQTEFAQPTNPNHVLGNFGHDCRPCHNTTVWMPSTFSHSTTRFPLTGAHQAVACNTCHVNNQYQNLPMSCFDCHAANFNGTTNPNHVSGNFSHDCTQCHSNTAWSPATFNHNTTLFPLTGVHITTPCQSCHVNGNYQLHYTDCYQCHQTDFQQVTNPNHVTQQFSHDCTPCHSTSVWRPNTMNHDTRWFRIYSGRHRQEWTQCSDCHTTIGNLTAFSCIDCHEHQQSNTDPEHQGVSGYSYSSPACYNCHRNV